MIDVQADLKALLEPRSLAIIGASADRNKLGGRAMRYAELLGFKGAVYAVNPKYDAIDERVCYRSIDAVPEPVDLAVLAVPPEAVPAELSRCVAAGARAAVILSGGFAESGAAGAALQADIVRIANQAHMPVCGPNSLGVINVATGMAATFSQGLEKGAMLSGPLAVVSQSGFFGTLIYVLAAERGLGTSMYVSTGNEALVGFGEYLSYLAGVADVSVVVGYVEGVRDGAALLEGARRLRDAGKTLLVLKVGRTETSSAAAQSHTGALTGSHAVFEAAFSSAGAILVADEQEAIDVATLAAAYPGRRFGALAVLTISGGAGILTTDLLAAAGVRVPALDGATRDRLAAILPAIASTANPVDATGNALTDPSMLSAAAEILSQAPGIDAVLVVIGMFAGAAEQITQAFGALRSRIPIVIVWSAAPPNAVHRLREAGVVVYAGTAAAAGAFGALKMHAVAEPPKRAATEEAATRRVLGEPESKALLERYGIPLARERRAADIDAAVEAALAIGFPVALKIDAPEIAHKTDVGGVALNVRDEAGVRSAYERILASVRAARPEVVPRGVLVAEMIVPLVEVLAGVTIDASFGPVVTIGLGGTAAEVLRDTALLLPPFSPAQAREALEKLRGAALFAGYRGAAVADVDALCETIVAIGNLALAERDRLVALDVNPIAVLACGSGVRVLDAFVVETVV